MSRLVHPPFSPLTPPSPQIVSLTTLAVNQSSPLFSWVLPLPDGFGASTDAGHPDKPSQNHRTPWASALSVQAPSVTLRYLRTYPVLSETTRCNRRLIKITAVSRTQDGTASGTTAPVPSHSKHLLLFPFPPITAGEISWSRLLVRYSSCADKLPGGVELFCATFFMAALKSNVARIPIHRIPAGGSEL